MDVVFSTDMCAGVQPCTGMQVEARGESDVSYSIIFHILPLIQGPKVTGSATSIALSPTALGYRYTPMPGFSC